MARTNIFKTRIIGFGTLTVLTGLVWISLDVYHSFTQNKITPQVQAQIEPLSPKLQTDVLNQLSSRRDLEIDFSRPYPYADVVFPQASTQPQSETLEFTPLPQTDGTSDTLTQEEGL